METKQLIKAIKSEYNSISDKEWYDSGTIKPCFEDYLADTLDVVNKIVNAQKQLAKDLDGAVKRHARELKEIEQNYSDLLGSCRHLVRKRYPDPSGGSDSFTKCEICGKEL